MQFIQYTFMCLYIGAYLFYHWSEKAFPEVLRAVNTWVMWGFLAWGGYWVVKVVLDCLRLGAKSQMTPVNVRNGILLAILNFIPVLLMALFMLQEGFVEK